MLARIKQWLGIPQSALSIRLDSDWRRTRKGTRWRHVGDTDHGIELRRELVAEYEQMHTGETATLVRKDAETEWHGWDEDWPRHAERAADEGAVWWADLDTDDTLPPLWGNPMGKGGSVWRRVD